MRRSFKCFLNVRRDFLFKHKIRSNKGCLVDALAIRGDEGRERLRKVRASCQYALTPECPNGETQSFMDYQQLNT